MKNIVTACLLILLLNSCEEDKQEIQQVYDSPVNGKETIFVDECVYDYVLDAKSIYDSVFSNAKVTLIPVSSRKAMAMLFADSAKGIMISRDYLQDEDSIVKSLSLQHLKIPIAQDGLVFFTRKDSGIDTVNIDQIHRIFNGEEIKKVLQNNLIHSFLASPSLQSSEYAFALHYFGGQKQSLSINMKYFSARDSVKKYVYENNAIGISMMSAVLKDSSLKPLRIGYTDSSGKRIAPQIVHPGFIVQKKYPLIVPIFAYLRDDKKNLAWGFVTYYEKDPGIQKKLLNHNIVPVYAKYNLIQED